MTRLNNRALTSLPENIVTPSFVPDDLQIGIVHLGPGAFHRAHQAVYTQLVDKQGQWGICAVSLRSAALKNALGPQNNLYTLMVLDEHPEVSIIGSLKEILVLADDRQRVMDRMASEKTHIISLSVTEKGYCLRNNGQLDFSHPDIKHDVNHLNSPVSAVGLLAAALQQRMDNNVHGLTIISCDNLPDNGQTLRRAILQFTHSCNPDLSKWVEQNVCFPDTMVDSITPATDDALRRSARQATGYEDAWPVQREAFLQWVIEDKFSGPRPPWENAGVIITKNVHQFEKAKLRVLNGSHSALAYLGALCEFKTVYEAISHDAMNKVIRQLLQEEVLPTLEASESLNPADYAEMILKRFRNPHIHHLLSQIAWDGSQKLPPRVLNTIRDNLPANRSINLLSATVAAWLVYIIRRVRNNESIVDPLAETFQSIANSSHDDITCVAANMLNDERIFGDLTQNHLFRDCVLRQFSVLKTINGANASKLLPELSD